MPIELFPLVQYAQYMGMVLFAIGAVGTVVFDELKVRQRLAYFVAAPGFMMAWGGGHLATDYLPHELFSPWQVGAFLSLVVSMNLLHWSVAARGRKNRVVSSVIVIAMVGAVALATVKPG